MNFTIPTIYYSLEENYKNDIAYSQLYERSIFDFSFNECSIFSNNFESIIDWFVYNTSIISENGEDLFIVCNAELSFLNNISNEDIIKCIVNAGEKGAQLLLGGLETARDLYRIDKNLIWTDLFFHCPFIVVYKSAFKSIIKAFEESRYTNHVLELFLSLNLDYKFFTYPFFTESKHDTNYFEDKQKWYNFAYSHFYEGIENQIETMDKISNILPYDDTKSFIEIE